MYMHSLRFFRITFIMCCFLFSIIQDDEDLDTKISGGISTPYLIQFGSGDMQFFLVAEKELLA